MEVFRELLSIKTFREDRAELAVRKQRRVLAEAVAALEAAERALDEYRDFSLLHERELYAELCRRIVRLRELEDAQLEVLGLRNRERALEEAQDQSARVRREEQSRLGEAVELHREATKMRQKFAQLAQMYDDEIARAAEQREDAEMEEVAELRRDRADWDESHAEAAL
jgi:type III secretion protein O